MKADIQILDCSWNWCGYSSKTSEFCPPPIFRDHDLSFLDSHQTSQSTPQIFPRIISIWLPSGAIFPNNEIINPYCHNALHIWNKLTYLLRIQNDTNFVPSFQGVRQRVTCITFRDSDWERLLRYLSRKSTHSFHSHPKRLPELSIAFSSFYHHRQSEPLSTQMHKERSRYQFLFHAGPPNSGEHRPVLQESLHFSPSTSILWVYVRVCMSVCVCGHMCVYWDVYVYQLKWFFGTLQGLNKCLLLSRQKYFISKLKYTYSLVIHKFTCNSLFVLLNNHYTFSKAFFLVTFNFWIRFHLILR